MKYKDWIHKILGTNKIEENNKILNELYWAAIFNNTISDSNWLKDKSFSPGRWAIGYPLFYVLYRILDEVKPNNILEFGLGQSSKMFYQYANHFNNVVVSTFEHDLDWANIFKKNNCIPKNVNITMIENEKVNLKGFQSLSIKNISGIVENNKYDLILVDAPYGSVRYSRPQILDLIPFNIDKNHFCILIDDYNRSGEKDTCTELEHLFNINEVLFRKTIYKGIKEFALYCSMDLKYLTTL